MEKLRKQFGHELAETLAKCPTLVADLAELRKHGVKIRKVSGEGKHCQAYSMRKRMTIYLGTHCSVAQKLIALAHEKVHVIVKPTPDPIPREMGRKEFIEFNLNAETDCIVHEVKVTAELVKLGLKVDDHSLSWLRRYKRGGRPAILKAMRKAITSNTGELYPDYYGSWYDEAVKPKHRLPFHEFSDKSGKRTATVDGASFEGALDGKELAARALARTRTTSPQRRLCLRFVPQTNSGSPCGCASRSGTAPITLSGDPHGSES
ncbi:MAG: hypothetical protein IT342_17860 [Candidatus Melainabacteria bacterium]|nr:hypothetical protein [Candidatus Melainabacteria bacterium]